MTSANIERGSNPQNTRFVKIDNTDPAAVKQARRLIKLLYMVGSSASRRWVKRNVRFRELELALAHICRGVLPDDDFGRDLLYVLACHIWQGGKKCGADAAIAAGAVCWAPWCGSEELEQLIERIAEDPRKWTADELAAELGITIAVRDALGLTTIGAVDLDKAGRARRRAQKSNDRRTKNRREQGVVPRAQWLAEHCKSKSEPWAPLRMSKSKYYRLGLHKAPATASETGPPASSIGGNWCGLTSLTSGNQAVGKGAERVERDGAEHWIGDLREADAATVVDGGFAWAAPPQQPSSPAA